MKTAAVQLGECLKDGLQLALGLVEGELVFGVVGRVGMLGEQFFVVEVSGGGAMIGRPPAESQIVGHAEEPAIQVPTRAAALEVMEEREKGLLDDVFGVVDREAKGEHIAAEPGVKLIEQMNDDGFEFGGPMSPRRRRCQAQFYGRVLGGHHHRWKARADAKAETLLFS